MTSDVDCCVQWPSGRGRSEALTEPVAHAGFHVGGWRGRAEESKRGGGG